MEIIVLASGSKGNATFIQTKNTKILIDAGISYLQLKNRLLQRDIVLKKLDAIIITHEHTDHLKHLSSIATKTNAKIYMSEVTYPSANARQSGALTHLDVSFIVANHKYTIGDLTIVPIELSHDVENCFGYLIKEKESNNITYGHITDTGYIPEEYISIISNLQVISIESNHDVKMLKESKRAWPLIERILSNIGHLSNVQCCNYLKQFNYQYVKTIILSHLSEECNLESIALKEVKNAFNGEYPCDVLIAKQHEPLPKIEVKDV